MDILQIFQNFQTQEQAIDYLEKVRWHGHPVCPYCKSDKVCRHASGDRKGQRWQCWNCERAFAVTVGTIFHGTHVPLKSWFLLLGLMLHAKKSASACQIARDLGMRRPTVWSMMHRVRLAMVKDQEQAELLYGIVEADETYIGGKPRKDNHHGGKPLKRGRGTKKTPVIGLMERGGRVIARPAKPSELGTKGLFKFVTKFVSTVGTLLVTDEWSGYKKVSEVMLHAKVNHAVEYANGAIHTNLNGSGGSRRGFGSLSRRPYRWSRRLGRLIGSTSGFWKIIPSWLCRCPRAKSQTKSYTNNYART